MTHSHPTAGSGNDHAVRLQVEPDDIVRSIPVVTRSDSSTGHCRAGRDTPRLRFRACDGRCRSRAAASGDGSSSTPSHSLPGTATISPSAMSSRATPIGADPRRPDRPRSVPTTCRTSRRRPRARPAMCGTPSDMHAPCRCDRDRHIRTRRPVRAGRRRAPRARSVGRGRRPTRPTWSGRAPRDG